MLKYMPESDLKTFKRTLLFSREQVSFFGNLDRRSHNSGTTAQRTDANLSDIIKTFARTIAGKNAYRGF